MKGNGATKATRSSSIRRWAAVGGVLVAAGVAVTMHLTLGSVAGTVTSKVMADPGCKTSTWGGFAGHSEITCSGATYTLHVRDSAGHDIEVGVDQATYEAAKVGAAYRE